MNKIVTDAQGMDSLLDMLSDSMEISFDTETDGLSFDRKMIGFSVSDGNHSFYVAVRHTCGYGLFSIEPDNCPVEVALEGLKTLFSMPNRRVWIHNAKFDLKVLRNEGLNPSAIQSEVLDTLAVSWLLNPSRDGGHGLKSLVRSELDYEMGQFSQFKDYDRNSDVPVSMMGKYAIDDALQLHRLARKLYPKLSKAQLKVLHELEMPVLFAVELCEQYGMQVDTKSLKEAGDLLLKEKVEIEQWFSKAYPKVQVGSSQSLSKQFCDQIWGTSGLKKGKNGYYSTDSETLEKFINREVPGTSAQGAMVAKKVLRYRTVNKFYSTYCVALVEAADKEERIHASFNQFGTDTGRFSCSKPNLQNVPSGRTPEGQALRDAFVAKEGYSLIVADYSQIELRMTAHLSRDSLMTEIYSNNGDIHQMTADACGCTRQAAKAVNFGLIYRMGSLTLSKRIGTTESEAQEYIDRYFERYAGVKTWQDRLISTCKKKQYTWTITGRNRQLPNINSFDRRLRSQAERIAINTQVQGSAADLIKISIRNFVRRLEREGYTHSDARIIGQVHDELIVECRSEISDKVSEILRFEMENCVQLNVPLLAEPSIAKCWGQAK